MISSVSGKFGKKTIKLKFSTRALMRLEAEHGGRPFDGILAEILTGAGGVTMVAGVLAAIMDDGKGVDQDAALDLIDQAGGYRSLMPLVSEAISVAFPEVKKAIEAAQAKADAEASDGDDQGKAEIPASA